jgi:thiamine biosynthesis protein ThiI
VFALAPIPAALRNAAILAVARQPGVAWISPAVSCAPTIEAMSHAAVALARKRTGSFKIKAKRTDKTLPFDSHRIHREVGAAVNAATGRAVLKDDPDDTYRIEVDRKVAWVHDAKIIGAGGLPVGSAGSVVTLLSGGIDSPVAAYRMMLRGCEVTGLHLWNRSYSGEGVRDKMLSLGRALARHQGAFRLVLIPFDGIQRAIVAASPDDLRMLLYRRAMLKVAAEVVRAGKHDAVIVGDSVSQVASQTMQNLAAVYDAAEGLLLTPLAGSCKDETIALAQKIGTYELSIGPGADCCGLLVAKHPRTRSTAAELREIEARYDLPALVREAAAERETHDFDPPGGDVAM